MDEFGYYTEAVERLPGKDCPDDDNAREIQCLKLWCFVLSVGMALLGAWMFYR